MLTFGDSLTEQSSMEEKKKKPNRFAKRKKQPNQNKENEITHEQYESQDNQAKLQSDAQSEQATVEVGNENSNTNPNKNNSNQSNSDQDNVPNMTSINSYANQGNRSQDRENQESIDRSLAFKIMSPKGLNKQIQHINLDKSQQSKQRNTSKQNIFQIEEGNSNNQPKHSNMIVNQLPIVNANTNSIQIFDDFNDAENIVKLFNMQILLIFEILSAFLVKKYVMNEDVGVSMIVGMGVLAMLGVISLIVLRIRKLQRILRHFIIILCYISIIVYVECRVIQMFSAFEKSVDIYINRQLSDVIKIIIYDKSQITKYNSQKYSIPGQRFLILQAIYAGCALIFQIAELFKSMNHIKKIWKILSVSLIIIYLQLRFMNKDNSCLIYIGIVSLLIAIILLVFKFQNNIIFYLCLTSNQKQIIYEMNGKPFSNQLNNSNQLNHSHIISPRFGGNPTNQQNDFNRDQFFASNKQSNGLINKNTLTLNKQTNQQHPQQQQQQQITTIEMTKAQSDRQSNNLFSPKTFLIHESLQYITPREELDSKREIDPESAKSDFSSNNNNQQQAIFSPTSNNMRNQNSDQMYPSFQQGQYSSKEQDNNNGYENQFQNDIEPHETSIRKTLECVGEQENEDDNEDDEHADQHEYHESDNIHDNEKVDVILYEGDRSDTARESVNTSRTIIPTQTGGIEALSQKNKEQIEKQRILKQAREAYKIRRKVAEQYNKQKIFNNSTSKGIEDKLVELDARLEMQDMILSNVSSGIVVVQKETNEVIYVNRQACINLNCTLDMIFQTLMGLKNIYTLKDELNNFSEIIQQFDSPLELSQLSTMRGLFMNHEKQKEIMICIQNNNSSNSSSFNGSQTNLPSSSDTASFSQKDWENSQQQNKMKQQIPNSGNNITNNSFSIKNYLDSNNFLQVEVDLIKRSDEKYVIFSINNINWNNPLNIIHTTTLKVQYFIRKMISELSIDMNDIKDYFNNLSSNATQKIDYNGCIGKIDCMTEFLQDFATSSLLISGTFIPIKQQMNLMQLVQGVIEKVKSRISPKQYFFNLQYDTICPINIFSDSKRLDRVFYNLLLYFIDTNEKALIKVKVQPAISNTSNYKKKLRIQISCSKQDDEEDSQQNEEKEEMKKKEGKKKADGLSFSLTQKKAQITNVYMLENMHYGVLLSNSIIQKLEPEDQGIFFQSTKSVSFCFTLTI